MEKPGTTFYLGKTEKTEAPQKPEEPKTGITYGGAMPLSFEHYQPEERSEEDLARARLLAEKHERKSMVVRRLLYIEKRRTELLGYMVESEKNSAKNRSFFGALLSLLRGKEYRTPKQKEWDMELDELHREHDLLEKEKESLAEEIRKLKELS